MRRTVCFGIEDACRREDKDARGGVEGKGIHQRAKRIFGYFRRRNG
jgi:hypothetical protein